ncbi:MAG: pyridoxamine 5'-phosphate oxidase family protein [Candidatus Geothermincolia bacterium]
MGSAASHDFEVLEPIIRRADVCRVGFCRSDMPYVVPMNFGYKDGCVFLHTSPQGKKMDILRENHNVCFEVDVDNELVEGPIACGSTMRFKSVIGLGRATLVEDASEKAAALDAIMEHYSSPGPHEYSPEHLEKVAIVKIELTEATARVHG